MTRFSSETERDAISRCLADSWAPAGRFEVCGHAAYVGYGRGPGAVPKHREATGRTFRSNAAANAPPAAALPGILQSRVVSLWGYIGSLILPPPNIRGLERDAWSRVLHLPGSAIPLRSFSHFGTDWGWPRLPSIAQATEQAARGLACRPGGTWQKYDAACGESQMSISRFGPLRVTLTMTSDETPLPWSVVLCARPLSQRIPIPRLVFGSPLRFVLGCSRCSREEPLRCPTCRCTGVGLLSEGPPPNGP